MVRGAPSAPGGGSGARGAALRRGEGPGAAAWRSGAGTTRGVGKVPGGKKGLRAERSEGPCRARGLSLFGNKKKGVQQPDQITRIPEIRESLCVFVGVT